MHTHTHTYSYTYIYIHTHILIYIYIYTYTHILKYIYIYTYTHILIPRDPIKDLCSLARNRFHKRVSLIVHYKCLKSGSGDLILQNPILRTRSCGTGVITEPGWLLHFHPTQTVGRKCCVPMRYQLRRSISGGPALKHFCMIHRVEWSATH